MGMTLLLGITGLTAVSAIDSVKQRLLQDERSSTLAAIQSGPLQIAKLHSSVLADTHLDELLSRVNERSPQIIGARITSGKKPGADLCGMVHSWI